MITILNTSILTNFGEYRYFHADLAQIRLLLDRNQWQSAVGHQATAEILTELMGVPVPVNRINYSQEVGEIAVVFKLRGRMPEGVILSREEIEKIGYDFGTIERLS